jgi:ketosteroid isomerase-like protein
MASRLPGSPLFQEEDVLHVALALTLTAVQASDSPATTRELTEIEARLAATYRSGDCDGWGALLAAEWSVIHITGAEITKAAAVHACKSAATKIDSLSSDNLVVRAFGDAAVVTGRTTASAGGQTVVLRFTDVFIRRDGRWLAVASQATPIVP